MLLDMYSRECLDIHMDKSIMGEMVACVLDKLKAKRTAKANQCG